MPTKTDDDSVITAAGLVSAAGDTPADLLAALRAGTRSTVTLTNGLPTVPIPGFDPKNYIDRKGLKHLSRTSQLGCAAASKLVETLGEVDPEEIGVVLGSAWAALETIVRFEREAHLEGARFVDPLLFTETVANVAAGQISIFFGWSAFSVTLSSGTGSGLEAIHRAREWLEEKRARIVVAGGADGLNPQLLRVLHTGDRTTSESGGSMRPDGADGWVGGEGACLLTVETRASAVERGARPLARLEASHCEWVGDGTNRAGFMAETLKTMLETSGTTSGEIDAILVSSKGAPDRGELESEVIGRVFGSAPDVVALNAVLAETWAASGALSVATALESLSTSVHPCFGVDGAGAVRRIAVIDCSDTGHFACVLLSAEEACHAT